MKWKIGNVDINNPVVLAPMAGTTNPAYIKICEEMGAGYAITELLSAEAISRNNKKTLEMLNGFETINIPIAVQLFGSNPKVMAQAAKTLTDMYDIKIIDINMGCPVPKVAVSANAGSALLKDPQKVYEIISEVVKSVDVPVTAKIRLGWDDNHINCVEIAKVIERAGASAITLHARTKKDGYSGTARWEYIKQVKEAVSIPVIGNGDIKSCYDAKKMMEETGCDAVMIGRASLGNPWLIKECVEYFKDNKIPQKITLLEKINMIKHHYQLLSEYKNESVALLEMRTNIMYYLKGLQESKEMKVKICSCHTKKEILDILDEYLSKYNAVDS